MSRRKKWLLWASVAVLVLVVALATAAYMISLRIEPYIRAQTIEYLQKRFDSAVEIGVLGVSMPMKSPFEVLLRGGRGVQAHVTAERVALWHKHRRDRPALIAMARARFRVELHSLWNPPVRVTLVRLDGLRIVTPPRGSGPPGEKQAASLKANAPAELSGVIIETIEADGANLSVLPRDPKKAPLEFSIRKLKLESAGAGIAFHYTAELTNPKPPGFIHASGGFGPWVAAEPSETPLSGDYVFENADLSVFKGIAGRLNSTGKFAGTLENIVADGETRTPDFRLNVSGNPVALQTKYHAIIDGANGNTLLQPVEATLGRTRFVVRGSVARLAGESGKTIALDVVFREGHIEDLMLLAVKGPKPMLRGPIALKVKLKMPPGKGEPADKLQLSGTFDLREASFTSPTVQDKIDELSSRAQGKPGDKSVDEVPTALSGSFRLANGVLEFSRLDLAIPGATMALAGKFTFQDESIDLRGKLRLQAKVSQTQTGWKRWALKPADPFFAKDGAGTQLRIRVDGTREQPRFGRDNAK